MQESRNHKSQWTWKHLREALSSVCGLLVAVLLFQTFSTGNRLVDIFLFGIGFRLLALGIMVWWFIRNVWNNPTRWSMIAGLTGAAMFFFSSWSGVRLFMHVVVGPLGSAREFYGLDLSSWRVLFLTACSHVALIVGGLLLVSYAKNNAEVPVGPTEDSLSLPKAPSGQDSD